MKLSIIIPFHRGMHFLEDCFESIRDQGLVGFETILVLDHVQEDLTQLISAYEDINIITVELKEPQFVNREFGKEEEKLRKYNGVAKARNAGLEAASGEYVYFIDSDDYILSDTLSLLLKEAKEKEVDIVYGKKASTWFRRIVYINALEEQQADEIIEVQDVGEEIDTKINLTRKQKRIIKLQQELEESYEAERELTEQKVEAYNSLFISRKGLRNVSVLGILIRRSFLNEENLRFDEKYKFFSDLIFVVCMLIKMKSSSYIDEVIYIKRKHNDPIHYPALSQIKTEDSFEEYISAYKQARECTSENGAIRRHLDEKLILYFTKTYALRLRRSEKASWRNNRFNTMRDCMKELNINRIKALVGYEKRLVNALLKGNVKRATKIVTIYLGYKKLKKIKKNKRVFSYYLYLKHFIKLPIKENWVFCESFFGKSYSDSPKYIYEYLCKNHPGKYRFIWVINHKTKIPYHPTKIRRFSIRYAYYLARCKYNVFNVRQPEWVRKRDGNVFLETWHGTPLKKLVFDQEEVMGASPLYKAQFYKQSRVWDYLVSANRFSTEAFRSAFLFDKEVLEFGYPRNDILYSENKEELSARIKKKLGIPQGKKTILYAPTWRDDEYYGRGEYKFALKLDLMKLMRELGEEYIILLRTHYFIADAVDTTGMDGFVFNLSKYDDISELYLISDMLITDYSSVFFDYANLKRPILFYTYDLDKYRDMLRGFYMDIATEVPGPLLFTSEEVLDAIRHIDLISTEFHDKYENFYERFCGLEDGHASEKVVKQVFDL